MRDFAANPGRLRLLPTGAKILYTAFIISALAGLLASWKLYGAVVGDAGARAYYGGEAGAVFAPRTPPPSAAAAAADGPALDLPQEAAAPRAMVEQISDRKLLEVTHFHLFSIPVYVLILAHLWLLARVPAWLHTAGILASVVTSGVHLAAPWLVRGSTSIPWLMPSSGIAMLVALGAIGLISGIDMWLPRATKANASGPADP